MLTNKPRQFAFSMGTDKSHLAICKLHLKMSISHLANIKHFTFSKFGISILEISISHFVFITFNISMGTAFHSTLSN